MHRRLLIGAVAALPLAEARAQGFPDRPIRVIVPFAAGGNADTLARILAPRLQERLGQPVVVENRPGAGGSLGAEAVARARPDGHMLLIGSNWPLSVNPVVQARLPYDPARDLQPIGMALQVPHCLMVQREAPWRDLAQLIAASGGRWRGVALVDEGFTDADWRALHEGGVRGVRFGFLPHLGGLPDLALLRRSAARLAEMGWHLVLHMDAAALLGFADLLRALPCPVVIDHMGRVPADQGLDQPAFRLLLELLRDPRFWVKISGAERISAAGPPFRDAIPFIRALVAAAPNRTLWGSDWPHPNVRWHPEEADLLDLLPGVADAAALRRVLVDNPARLYGFP